LCCAAASNSLQSSLNSLFFNGLFKNLQKCPSPLGYKVVSAGGFVFDINAGAGRAFVNNNTYESGGVEQEVDWPEIIFQGKLGVGYRFGGKK
jgi:hypothetical protein